MIALLNFRRVLLSAVMIAFVVSLAYAGTTAFFSDTETSNANTFTAGDIDLQIDNESYAIDHNIPNYPNPVGDFVASPNNSWTLTDLTVERFFDFIDLKPGDYGEDTISIHVGSNDAWVCAAAQITEDLDNDITEPEDEESGANNDNNDGTPDGDLDSELNFAFWVDDGDNVLEGDEVDDIFINGTLAEMGAQGQITLADSGSSILPNDGPIPGGDTFYIAKGWCFGEMTANPVAQDTLGKQEGATNGPLVRGTGFTCNGSGATNLAQTDSVVGDIEFYAEQARNNDNFLCSNWTPSFEDEEPEPEPVATGTLTLVKDVVDVDQIDDEPADTTWALTASGTVLISGAEGAGAVTSAVVPAGDYVLTESSVEGYSQTGLECTGNGGALVLAGGDTVTVAAGDTVVCTFTNTEVAQVIQQVG